MKLQHSPLTYVLCHSTKTGLGLRGGEFERVCEGDDRDGGYGGVEIGSGDIGYW